MSKLIAISGGIGSGKSVVCRCLRQMGYAVYDSDSRAKALLDRPDVCRRVSREISPDVFDASGRISRRLLAAVVFGDPEKLRRLNAILHPLVADDLRQWRGARPGPGPLFVETAIVRSSGLDRIVDETWVVEAPAEVRLARAMARDGTSAQAVLARMEAQKNEAPRGASRIIVNDGRRPLLPQLLGLIAGA